MRWSRMAGRLGPTLRSMTQSAPAARATRNFRISSASDGKIYYVLCSEAHNVAGQMYSFDPAAKKITHLGDLTEACGEKDAKAVAQGKSHVNFVECQGRLYFATHTGFYAIIDDMEKIGKLGKPSKT